jgi:uncharacterized protein (DUF302 family)
MGSLSIKIEARGNFDELCKKMEEAIKPIGFGILTRIDFDQKIQEKLNEKIDRCVIFGACNPRLALDAYRQSTDVALLIPCNIVVRSSGADKVVIEAMRPSKMLEFVEGAYSNESIVKAEKDLERVILSLG